MGTDKNKQNSTLSEKQRKAIPVILAARTITEGCKNARISRDSFYLWLKEPDFKAEFERQRKDTINLALHELRALAGDAVEVLRKLLKAKQEGVRLRTAMGILDHIAKFLELEAIERRLEDLEMRMGAHEKH
jgi:hypothetical protein